MIVNKVASTIVIVVEVAYKFIDEALRSSSCGEYTWMQGHWWVWRDHWFLSGGQKYGIAQSLEV